MMDFDFGVNVDELFNFNVLFFDTNDPDMRVVEMSYDVEIAMLIEKEIGTNAVQTIMSNQDRHTKDRCPYFRVVATPPSENIAKNYKFEAFLRKIGQGSLITPRCAKVLVVGLHALNNLDSPISMPLAFCTTSIENFAIDSLGVVDMSCVKPLGAFNIQSSEDLMKISGMRLPVHLPDNVQWKILSYCEAPTAAIIKDTMQAICEKWDCALLPMFLQRDARIPPPIACAYNVPCVASTIVVATRPFLAPLA
jgi:hypothetical protein